MGLFGKIGTAVGTVFGPVGAAAGNMLGGQIDKAGSPGALMGKRDDRFYVDPGPRPEYGGYKSIREGGAGLLEGDLRQQYGSSIADRLDTRGIQAFRERALAAPGTSAWEQMARNKQALEEQALRQRAQESGAARAAEARSALARRGGLSSGASERMARASMRDILSGQQEAARQGASARADIGLQAEQQRLAALGQLPGMEISQLAPQFDERKMQLGVGQYNITNALEQKKMEEAAKMAEYQERMRAWAAANQANAIAASGPAARSNFEKLMDPGGFFGAFSK